MSKKGALNLGISTIVVLVIAMVLIAGFVSFIRTFLDAGEDSLMGAFDVADFGRQPDAQNPLVIASGSITLGQRDDDTARVPIGYYNANSEIHDEVKLLEDIACGDDAFKLTSINFEDVNPGDAVGFKTIIGHGEGGADPGEYVCRIKAVDNSDEQLASLQTIITVTG